MRIRACSIVLALSTSAVAAAETGSLSGTVIDAVNQSPVSEAVVTARSPALVGEQTVLTDSNGLFEITLLPPGTYDLTVKHDGFQTFSPGGLQLKAKKVTIRVAILQRAAPAPAAAPAPVRETAIEFDEASMTAPAMISGPNPEYTEDAIERGVEGTMMVRCVVSTQGRVRGCKVQKGLPFMDKSVVRALEARTYRPALRGGKPVDVFFTFTLKLKLPSP